MIFKVKLQWYCYVNSGYIGHPSKWTNNAITMHSSRHRRFFIELAALKNLAIFTVYSAPVLKSHFNNVAGFRPSTL